MGVSNSYVWGLICLRFGVSLLTFGVKNSYVWLFGFLRLRVKDSYLLGLVCLRLGVSKSYVLRLRILTFGG